MYEFNRKLPIYMRPGPTLQVFFASNLLIHNHVDAIQPDTIFQFSFKIFKNSIYLLPSESLERILATVSM